jgi:hypothetical protein
VTVRRLFTTRGPRARTTLFHTTAAFFDLGKAIYCVQRHNKVKKVIKNFVKISRMGRGDTDPRQRCLSSVITAQCKNRFLGSTCA